MKLLIRHLWPSSFRLFFHIVTSQSAGFMLPVVTMFNSGGKTEICLFAAEENEPAGIRS